MPFRVSLSCCLAAALALVGLGTPAVAQADALPAVSSPSAAVPAALSPASCSALDDLAYQIHNQKNDASLVTTSAAEAAAATGFVDKWGPQFKVSVTPVTGLVPVYRLYNPRTNDFIQSFSTTEIAARVAHGGYVKQGVSFYASPAPSTCTVPVLRFVKGNMHLLGTLGGTLDRRAAATGWRSEGKAFHVAPLRAVTPPPVAPTPPPVTSPSPTDTTFSIAVYPDTQQEVFGTDSRFVGRTNWLLANRTKLDLRYVLHTGDVVNWGDKDPAQFTVASAAMAPLDKAGIPYQMTIGNHDTAAVCPGGGGCPGKDARVTVRDTTAFNRFFPTSRFPGETFYEAGKVDNGYRTFSAGGVKWLVLNLELWPRPAVVDWARSVVASYPSYNVIVETHSYLTSTGAISASREYGTTTPQYLYDRLISQYANIRFVFSGHVGQAAYRTDTGVHGNRITSMLGTFHSNTTNPVRIVEINTATGTATTRVYGPQGNVTLPYNASFSGLKFIK
ncbi:metallophosphoesterase [Tersicoccus sp. MR15.9]|uniref:metallophosphoesterase n=1 Tax=Tersicoccus mangrovi TaxID=3121635 RepID=UPI002FE571C9